MPLILKQIDDYWAGNPSAWCDNCPASWKTDGWNQASAHAWDTRHRIRVSVENVSTYEVREEYEDSPDA